MSSQIHKTIEVQATALGPVLYAGVASSLANARRRSRGFAHHDYPHLIPHLMRVALREYLKAHPVPNGWVIGGDPKKMAQLFLVHNDLSLRLRFLKERRATYPNGVPVAGKNAARQGNWISEPLDIQIPAPGITDPVNLLLLWDFRYGKKNRPKLDQFSLRIVHTTGPGIYGKAVPCDLILDVQDGGSVYSRLVFAGSSDDEDLFNVRLDEEGNDSGS